MLDNEQLEELTEELDEFGDLESIIKDGVKAKYPIVLTFPNGKKAKAMIKPISGSQFELCMRRANEHKEALSTLVCEKCLFNQNDKPLKKDLIKIIPGGVLDDILTEIYRVSGINFNQETQKKFNSQMMGF